METYRKKPVEVQAVQYTGDNLLYILETIEDAKINLNSGLPYIRTLEGDMTLVKGDYIIKGIKGEFYPCKEDIFLATYDKV